MPLLRHLPLDAYEREIVILETPSSHFVPVRTAETLLERDTAKLAQETKISLKRIQQLKRKVAEECSPINMTITHNNPFDTAASLRHWHAAHVSAPAPTGCAALDTLLGGGVAFDALTEVMGRSSTGKTQLCFCAAVAVAEQGKHVLYVDTTNSFSARRLQEIIRERHSHLDRRACDEHARKVMGRIACEPVYCMWEALSLLEQVEQYARTSDKGIDLLVIDSITTLVAPHLGGKGNYAGQAYMGHLIASLHRLASCCVGVVVTNEARGDEDLASLQRGIYDPERFRPALGKSWTYAASTRIHLSAQGLGIPGVEDPLISEARAGGLVTGREARERAAVLLKHSSKPTPEAAPFAITAAGVVDVQSGAEVGN